MTTPPELHGATLAADNPAAANAAVASFEASAQTPFPVAPEIVPDRVTLPMGFVAGDKIVRDVTLRELNGHHEEALARASKSRNYYHYLTTLLESGVKQIGDLSEADTKKRLKSLCAGDRDFLVIAIRRVTYGDTVEIGRFPCPACEEELDIKVNLDSDIENIEKSAEDALFEVKLRNSKTARCRLPNGYDQEELGALKSPTVAESNTVLIKNCVSEIVDDKTGRAQSMMAFPSLARELGMQDRAAIIKEIMKQPGPQYNDVKYTCPGCETEGTLVVDVGALFLV